jgi:predicted dehydrogenase
VVAPTTTPSPLRVAIVGGGIVGRDQASAFAAQPDARLVAFVGRDAERTAAVAARFGALSYLDLEQLMSEQRVDAVSVCTPTGLHRRFVEIAAAAGAHVLLEKPMATSVDDCDAIDRACRAAGVTLMLGFTHRFHPELQEAARIVGSGGIGKPMLAQDVFSFGEFEPWPDWYYDHALSGGGELMHDGVHMADRLEWVMGSRIVDVFGRTTSYARGIHGVEDGGVAIFAFENGAIASIFVNQARYPLRSDADSVPMPGRMELEIHGARGTIRYRTWHELVVDIAGEATRTIARDGPGGEMRAEVREFLDAVREGRPPIVGAAEGRRGIAVIQAIYESERRGRPVRVDELYPRPMDLA